MIVAECYFLDVGQATCQVIDLGDDTAIVIDCGAEADVLLQLLCSHLRIHTIAALVLSHNHDDHTRGLEGLIHAFAGRIDRVYLPLDRAHGEMKKLRAYGIICRESELGTIRRPLPLFASDGHRLIHPVSADGSVPDEALRVDVLFPDLLQSIEMQDGPNPINNTSAVIQACCGDKRILFPGDTELAAWKAIHEMRKAKLDEAEWPIKCDVTAVSHHGGQIVRYKRPGESYADLHRAIRPDLDWLYTRAITARYAIVSVGSRSPYRDRHPLPVHIRALCDSGAGVMCTQITHRCCSDLDRVNPAVLMPQSLPGAALLDKPKGVACAGTVRVSIGPDEIIVERYDEHLEAIPYVLSFEDHPICFASKQRELNGRE